MQSGNGCKRKKKTKKKYRRLGEKFTVHFEIVVLLLQQHPPPLLS
jgi:hypothetical protein